MKMCRIYAVCSFLITTFSCYGMEPELPLSGKKIEILEEEYNPDLPKISTSLFPKTKILAPLNVNSISEWKDATSSLKKQFKALIQNPANRVPITSEIGSNINSMTAFINTYIPPNDTLSTINLLKSLLVETQKGSYTSDIIYGLGGWLAKIDSMEQFMEPPIKAALAKLPQQKESPKLLISKEVATTQKQNEESLSQEIYTSEIEVISIITSILRAILNNEETSPLRRSFQETRTSIIQSLKRQKKALENTPQPQLVTKEIDKINLKIHIAQTLNYFYAIKIQKASGNEKTTPKDTSNFVNHFVNHFIDMAALIEKTAFDEFDRKLIEYLINNSFFIKYFAHEDEETTTLVPKEKKEEFYKAYTKIIKNILKPSAVVTASEEPITEPLNQPEVQNPPVIVAPSEPKVEQPLTEIKPNKEAIKQAAVIVAQRKQEQPPQVEKPAETNQKAKEQPAAPKPPTPSLWSSITTPVSNFVSNVLQGIKNLFGTITLWLSPKPPTSVGNRAIEIVETLYKRSTRPKNDRIEAANELRTLDRYFKQNKSYKADLIITDIEGLADAILKNDKPRTYLKLGELLEKLNQHYSTHFEPSPATLLAINQVMASIALKNKQDRLEQEVKFQEAIRAQSALEDILGADIEVSDQTSAGKKIIQIVQNVFANNAAIEEDNDDAIEEKTRKKNLAILAIDEAREKIRTLVELYFPNNESFLARLGTAILMQNRVDAFYQLGNFFESLNSKYHTKYLDPAVIKDFRSRW